MKIARIETVRADVPPPGEGFRPAWGPGLLQRTWSNVLVKVFTDAGIIGYAAGHAHRAQRRAVHDRPGSVRPRIPSPGSDQCRRPLLHRHRALGHHRQGVWPAPVQALRRPPDPGEGVRGYLRSGHARAPRRGRPALPRGGFHRAQAPVAQLDLGRGRRPRHRGAPGGRRPDGDPGRRQPDLQHPEPRPLAQMDLPARGGDGAGARGARRRLARGAALAVRLRGPRAPRRGGGHSDRRRRVQHGPPRIPGDLGARRLRHHVPA